MTAKFVWNELKKLVVIDHDINSLTKQITKHQAAIAQQKEPLTALQMQKEELAGTIKQAQKDFDANELEVASLKIEDQKKQAVLETLFHHKEIEALEHELAILEDRIDEIEDEMVNLMDTQEIAQKKYDELINQLSEAEKACAEAAISSKQAIQEAQAKIDALQKQWDKQAKNVPPELSKNYMEIRARVANPVVPIVSSSCSACFYGLLSQDTAALSKATVIRCRGCYRFLFIPNEHTIEQESQNNT